MGYRNQNKRLRPVAPRLLWVWLATAAAGACLWPAEYYVVPEPFNSPPVINTRAIQLEPEGLREVDGVISWDPATSPEVTFTLVDVLDLDTDDTLFVRWLVAHDATVPALNVARAEDELPPNGTTRRINSFTLRRSVIDAVDAARDPPGGTPSNRPYVVEVLIGDRRPPFGALPTDFGQGAVIARWRWVVVKASTGGG